MKPTVLAGRRVLLVEDELLIAMLVESALGDAGCTVVGPYASVGAAKTAARGESLDLAVLDINLAGEMVFPVAELLEGRGVPFLLLSGYGNDALPPGHRNWPICGKPFRTGALLAMLAALIQPRPHPTVERQEVRNLDRPHRAGGRWKSLPVGSTSLSLFIQSATQASAAAAWRRAVPSMHDPDSAVLHGHWKTSTVVGALRCDGVSATGVFDGAKSPAQIHLRNSRGVPAPAGSRMINPKLYPATWIR